MFSFQRSPNNVISIKVSGKLTHEDYKNHFIPKLNEMAEEHNPFNIMILTEDFHGWELRAALDDLLAGIKFRNKIGRVAIVGEKSWQEKLCQFFSMLFGIEAHYFTHEEKSDAKKWVAET
jgi:hypothetical protein